MSLLLDALKKAAEKKAKLGADKKNIDVTEVDATAIDATERHATSFDTTLRTGVTESAPLEATELDATAIDSTELDATATEMLTDPSALAETTQELTAIEVTQLEPAATDSRSAMEDDAKLEATSIDATELDADATVIDDSKLAETTQELSAIDVTELETPATPNKLEEDVSELEDTALDTTLHDQTELDATALDITALDATTLTETTGENSDLSAAQLAATEFDTTSADHTELEATSLDSTEVDATSTVETDRGQQDTSDPKFRSLDLTDSDHAEFDIEQDFNLGDDQTTQLGEDFRELNYFGLDSEFTSRMQQAGEKTFEIPALKKDPDEEEFLTEEDVTEFMGDGLTDVERKRSAEADSRKKTQPNDDTTLTNSESLTLTNFGYEDLSIDYQDDEDSSLRLDETSSDTDSLRGYPDSGQNTTGLSLKGMRSEEDKSTVYAGDSTSTSSSIDIDRLTSDETVTVEGKTATRTYAPDNYDRTLLNMSDKDVSRIFPGMRPETDAVMTPDYAKKVFLSRSGQQKTHYFKIYAGVGLLLLLAVVLTGLFRLQNEADLIDQRVAGLKRDPMPGVIKSSTGEAPIRLFEPVEENADIKTLDVLATADRTTADAAIPSAPVKMAQADSAENKETSSESVTDPATLAVNTDIPLNMQQALAKPDRKMQTTTVRPVSVAATSSLQLSVKNQLDSKDEILSSAYQAYMAGDLVTARSDYNKVLELDNTSRDALLGRAAIHIQDNEYQQAINKYQQILVINPKDSMAMTSLIAVANINPQAGEAQLKNLIYEQPDSAYLHFALGNLYGSQNRWAEAQKSYFDALQFNQEEPNYAYNLAVSLEHIGKPAVAINYYQKALDNRSKGLATFNRELVVARIEVLAQ